MADFGFLRLHRRRIGSEWHRLGWPDAAGMRAAEGGLARLSALASAEEMVLIALRLWRRRNILICYVLVVAPPQKIYWYLHVSYMLGTSRTD